MNIMPSNTDSTSRDEKPLVDTIRSAESLSELADVLDADTEHDAYFEAKELWRKHHDGWFESSYQEGLPGDVIRIDGHDFHIHGITHAGTEEERDFLHDHVSRFHDNDGGTTIYCEQGVRRMYFDDFPGVCEMDDYRWSLERVKEMREEVAQGTVTGDGLDGSGQMDDIDRLRSSLCDSVFSLVESGTHVYGERFGEVLGDVASDFLTSHVDASRGDDFESFRLTRDVARNPRRLGELQAYYRRNLLPQPLESDWMRKHDPEIEVFTHARNERMADYAVYHNEEDEEVHIIAGAAHQPGVVYYLEEHRDGERNADEFELFG